MDAYVWKKEACVNKQILKQKVGEVSGCFYVVGVKGATWAGSQKHHQCCGLTSWECSLSEGPRAGLISLSWQLGQSLPRLLHAWLP